MYYTIVLAITVPPGILIVIASPRAPVPGGHRRARQLPERGLSILNTNTVQNTNTNTTVLY